MRDHSNFSLAMALMAGAFGMPYVPVRSLLGSDILEIEPRVQADDQYFAADAEPVVLVPPLKADVAILAVQRADASGNAHLWGSTGVAAEAAMGAARIIVLADEIVERDVIASDPNRVLFPGWRTAPSATSPAGCHPSPMVGCWQRDNAFFNDYHARSRDASGFTAWVEEWVLDPHDHAGYCAKLGARLDGLRIRGRVLAAPANFAAE